MTNDERKPKSESRSSNEIRNSKPELNASPTGTFSSFGIRISFVFAVRDHSSFMIRISFGFRASDFGFSISPRMKLGAVIGRVTLSKAASGLDGARWLIVSPFTREHYQRGTETPAGLSNDSVARFESSAVPSCCCEETSCSVTACCCSVRARIVAVSTAAWFSSLRV